MDWIGESNGLRAYRIGNQDRSKPPKLFSHNLEIANDTHTPTPIGSFLVTIDQDLVAIDPANGLCVVDTFRHKSLDRYAAVMSEQNHALVCCSDGTVLLLRIEDLYRPTFRSTLRSPDWRQCMYLGAGSIVSVGLGLEYEALICLGST